jgi:hypothetical protein
LKKYHQVSQGKIANTDSEQDFEQAWNVKARADNTFDLRDGEYNTPAI